MRASELSQCVYSLCMHAGVRKTQAVIVRCGQPQVGPGQRNRCKEDEQLLNACLPSLSKGKVLDTRAPEVVAAHTSKGMMSLLLTMTSSLLVVQEEGWSYRHTIHSGGWSMGRWRVVQGWQRHWPDCERPAVIQCPGGLVWRGVGG